MYYFIRNLNNSLSEQFHAGSFILLYHQAEGGMRLRVDEKLANWANLAKQVSWGKLLEPPIY